MPKFVTALFENSNTATEAIDALKKYGLPAYDIQHIDKARQEQGFFQRLFLDDNGDKDRFDYSVMGIPGDSVEFYSQLVRQGYSLVIALSDDERVDEVDEIMRRPGAIDPERLILRHEKSDEEWTHERPPPTSPSGAPMGRWFKVVDVQEQEWGERNSTQPHTAHIASKEHLSPMDITDLFGAELSPTFQQLEPQFRDHFQHNFADHDLSFRDVRLAYRYGVRLGEHEALLRRDWPKIEEHARQHWRDQGGGPWEIYGVAVQFGWQRARDARDARFVHP